MEDVPTWTSVPRYRSLSDLLAGSAEEINKGMMKDRTGTLTFGLIFVILWGFLLVVLHSDRCVHLGGAYAPTRLSCTGVADFPSFLRFSVQPQILFLSVALSAGTASVLHRLFNRFTRRPQ
jgi:hypothetical protein